MTDKKGKRIAIIVCFTAVIAFAAVLFWPRIPEGLKNSRNQSEEATIEVTRTKQNKAHAAVFYPVGQSDSFNRRIKETAESLLSNAMYREKEEIKVDYTVYSLTQDIMSIVFDFVSNQDECKDYASIIWDFKNDKELILEELADQKLMKEISRDVRNALKKMDSMGDAAWNLAIYEETKILSDDSICFFDNENLNIYFKKNTFGNHEAFTLNYPLNEEANHIQLDLGITSPADPLVEKPERVIDPNRPMIAITFDDGPYRKNTLALIEIFEQYDQAATFYLLGSRIPGAEDLVVELANHGHEVASHSYSHPNLPKLSGSSLEFQLSETSRLVHELSEGAIEVGTFRPPYGASSQKIKAVSPHPFILWNVDTLDWKTRDTDSIIQVIREEVSDGDVLLLHELYDASVEAIRQVVPELIEQGYQLVTVQELFTAKGIELKAGSTYCDAN